MKSIEQGREWQKGRIKDLSCYVPFLDALFRLGRRVVRAPLMVADLDVIIGVTVWRCASLTSLLLVGTTDDSEVGSSSVSVSLVNFGNTGVVWGV